MGEAPAAAGTDRSAETDDAGPAMTTKTTSGADTPPGPPADGPSPPIGLALDRRDRAVLLAWLALSETGRLAARDKPAATSLAWYRDVLGLSVIRTFERGEVTFAASLRAGAVPILLTQDDGALGPDRAKGAGISLRFTTAQDVDALAASIIRRGGTIESPPFDGPGGRAFRLRDPDGFRLVIST